MSAAERVVIVGAGAAGPSTAAALSNRGVDALVLDRDDRIGGTWSRRYERLHSTRFGDSPGSPTTRYCAAIRATLSKDEYASYLAGYAERFRLRVSLGESVGLSLSCSRRKPPVREIETREERSARGRGRDGPLCGASRSLLARHRRVPGSSSTRANIGRAVSSKVCGSWSASETAARR